MSRIGPVRMILPSLLAGAFLVALAVAALAQTDLLSSASSGLQAGVKRD